MDSWGAVRPCASRDSVMVSTRGSVASKRARTYDLPRCLDHARSALTGAARIVFISIFRVCARLRRRSVTQSALTGRYPWAFDEFCPHLRQMILWFRGSSATICRFVLTARIPAGISTRSEKDYRLCRASNSSTDRTLRVYVVPRVPDFLDNPVLAGGWSRELVSSRRPTSTTVNGCSIKM